MKLVMRNKIDYGIDLGTTNSAIARMENGVPTIKKSETFKDTIPSCVHYNKKQDVLVGDKAIGVLNIDNSRALKSFVKGTTNTFLEFKRIMGSTETKPCPNLGRDITSEELSSEVLKKLKSLIQDDTISSIVITVPANFLNPQTEATMKAAKMAGFKHVELLQEPVAAATAYGLGSKSKDGFWLVFDFGGGTFDSALIKAEDGVLSVKDTDGDNWLGGKNLDEAIVDQIILPKLQSTYAMDGIINDANKRQILREALKPYAEEIKIEISFKPHINYVSPLGSLPFEDENGEEPEIEVSLTESDLEEVLSPIFQKAIDIAKELLKRNNLKGSNLGALVLVGGPTHSPILRSMLKDQITEKVDTSIDPMTVVAKGAALFASTISVSDEVKEEKRDKTKLQLELKYEATSVEVDEMINIKILRDKTIGTIPEKVFVEFKRFDGAWTSSKTLIGDKPKIIDVLLVEGRSNNFEINVFDEVGNKIECQPSHFNILQGIAGLDGMQVLPHHIGIAKFFHAEERDLFQPIKGLEKSKKVPATGVIIGLKTRSTIRPGKASDIIRIPIYQGEYNASGTNPVLNNLINEVIITGESIPALLPEGSDVDITIKVDRSQLMQFNAYFPLLNHTEELDIDIKQTEPPTDITLTKEIGKAKKIAIEVEDIEALNNLEGLESQLENEKGSADGRLKILDGLRKELLKLEVIEKSEEWSKVEQDLKNSFYELDDLIDKIKANSYDENLNMEKIEAHLMEYRNRVEQIIKDKDNSEAKKLIQEIGQMDFNIRNAVTGNALDVQLLSHFNESFNSFHWTNANKARQLLNQGMQMATAGETAGIRQILVQLIGLLPDNEKPKDTLG